MKCDSWNCPICRWRECVGDRQAAKEFGWCEKTDDELEDELIEMQRNARKEE